MLLASVGIEVGHMFSALRTPAALVSLAIAGTSLIYGRPAATGEERHGDAAVGTPAGRGTRLPGAVTLNGRVVQLRYHRMHWGAGGLMRGHVRAQAHTRSYHLDYQAANGHTVGAELLGPRYTMQSVRATRLRLPLVIAMPGRNGDGRAECQKWADIPGQYGLYVICPDARGRNGRLGTSYGDPGRIDDVARLPEATERLLEHVPGMNHIDLRRICLAGCSMGGQEALLLAARHPQLAAAVISEDGPVDLADRWQTGATLRTWALGARASTSYRTKSGYRFVTADGTHISRVTYVPYLLLRRNRGVVGMLLDSKIAREVGCVPRDCPDQYAERSPISVRNVNGLARTRAHLLIAYNRDDISGTSNQTPKLIRRLRSRGKQLTALATRYTSRNTIWRLGSKRAYELDGHCFLMNDPRYLALLLHEGGFVRARRDKLGRRRTLLAYRAETRFPYPAPVVTVAEGAR